MERVRRGDYLQLICSYLGKGEAVVLTGHRRAGKSCNLKLIKDNYPKYVVTMDPNVGLIHDSGIVACSARQFLMDLMS